MTHPRTSLSLLLSALAFASLGFAADARSTTAPGRQSSGRQIVNKNPAHTVRADKGADWHSYAVLRFMPAVYEPANPQHRLKPNQVPRITAAFDTDLSRAFRDGRQNQGATLDVKPVITDIKKSNTLVNAISFAAISTAVCYGRASVRYELIDDATGTLVGEVENRGDARPWNIYPWQILSDFQPLGHSYIMLNREAKALRKDLRKLLAQVPGRQGSQMASTAH